MGDYRQHAPAKARWRTKLNPMALISRSLGYGILGTFAGLIVASHFNPLPLGRSGDVVPEPYRLPKIPGGTALRLAMVHDILHERYLRHGDAWYTQRNTDARKILAQDEPKPGAAPSIKCLDAMDDLAVGLDRTGHDDQAIEVLRKKLALVSPLPPPPATRAAFDAEDKPFPYDLDSADLEAISAARDLPPLQHHQYTTCANLGTMLVHGYMAKAQAGDADAMAKVKEGLGFIERSIAINPGAHFGRERWQAIAIEALLADIARPDLLMTDDLIGEPLNKPFIRGNGRLAASVYARNPPNFSDPAISDGDRLKIRWNIDRVGIDPDWAAVVNPDYPDSMPFDEPALALIGMWTLGGGPNPHSAMAMGRIMENIGQYSIAWEGYERAVELQDHFWPDARIRANLVSICKDRQAAIAQIEAPSKSDAWQASMRARHVAELAWGQAYQKAYHEFEASQIAAGVPLDDPKFYNTFFQNRPNIASDPGLSDDILVIHKHPKAWADVLPCMLLGLGIGMAFGELMDRDLRRAP
jgi:hypothetical protein